MKTLSLRIDDDLLTRIDEWGMAHLEDGEVRYNRNATLKRLLEMALAIPDQEELDDEGVEAATPSIGEMTLDDLLDRIEERQRKVASEGRAETVNQVLAGTKMLSDALYRDMSTAINAGKKLTSGALTMNAGTTLEVAQSGDVTLDGALTCAEGTTLKFNFTTGRTAPKLVLSQTPTFGAVKVDVAGVRPTRKNNTLIEWPDGTVWPEGFNIASVFSLADNPPDWVTGIAVEGDSLVLLTKPRGTMIIVR